MLEKIGIIGAGVMGRGIAAVAANAGFPVLLCDKDNASAERGLEKIKEYLDLNVRKGKISESDKERIASNITAARKMEELASSDFIIEAVAEDCLVKSGIFSALDKICKPETVFVSNTSTIPITKLAQAVKRRDKFAGMHFMNPVSAIKLVEVIRGEETSDLTVAAVKDIAAAMGKITVEINDSPGFAVNRILIPMINEAAFCLQDGIASRDDIDKAMKIGASFPMGPLELADLIGIDICLRIMEELEAGFGDKKYRPCPLLKKMVESGNLGKKSGRGFYDHN